MKMKPKEIKNFTAFLERAGAQILNPTSEWEILRFKANEEVGIVYQNKKGQTTFVMQANVAYDAFMTGKPYSATVTVNRKRRSVLLRTLLDRDGHECFYCGIKIEEGKETIEHLFSINQGGNNHINNLVLAHEVCNQKANHLPVIKKVLLRDSMRKENKNVQSRIRD